MTLRYILRMERFFFIDSITTGRITTGMTANTSEVHCTPYPSRSTPSPTSTTWIYEWLPLWLLVLPADNYAGPCSWAYPLRPFHGRWKCLLSRRVLARQWHSTGTRNRHSDMARERTEQAQKSSERENNNDKRQQLQKMRLENLFNYDSIKSWRTK